MAARIADFADLPMLDLLISTCASNSLRGMECYIIEVMILILKGLDAGGPQKGGHCPTRRWRMGLRTWFHRPDLRLPFATGINAAVSSPVATTSTHPCGSGFISPAVRYRL
jgi:hypothetical protein